MNSFSPAYSFLCFRKIVESMWKRRARLGTQGKPAVASKEAIPHTADDSLWLGDLFLFVPEETKDVFPQNIRGWKFSRVYDEMRPLRDRIAHALFEQGKAELDWHSVTGNDDLYQWSFVARCMARRMMRNEFPGSVAGINAT
jgi:hypothetical protein